MQDSADQRLRPFVEGLAGAAAARLAELLGADVRARIRSCGRRDDASLRSELPADGGAVVLTVGSGEDAGSLILFFGRAAVLHLAAHKNGLDDAGLAARVDDGLPIAADDHDAVADLASALGDVAAKHLRAAGETTIGEPGWQWLANSTWSGDGDPLPQGSTWGATVELAIGATEGLDALILIAAELAEAGLPDLAVSVGDSPPRLSGALWIVGEASFESRVRAALGVEAEIRVAADLGALVTAFESDDCGGAIVGVARNRACELALIRALRELEGCADKPLVVVLEDPSPVNVVRCGRAGLFSVLPAEFTTADLSRRLGRSHRDLQL